MEEQEVKDYKKHFFVNKEIYTAARENQIILLSMVQFSPLLQFYPE